MWCTVAPPCAASAFAIVSRLCDVQRHRAVSRGDAAAAHQANGSTLEALAGLHPQHGAVEQDPAVERVDGQRSRRDRCASGPPGEAAGNAQARSRSRIAALPRRPALRMSRLSSGARSPRRSTRQRRRNRRSVGNARHGAIQRRIGSSTANAVATTDAVVVEKRARERVGLGVEHEMDAAHTVERDLLGDAAGAMEAERSQNLRESRRRCLVDRELENATPSAAGVAGGSARPGRGCAMRGQTRRGGAGAAWCLEPQAVCASQ